MIVNILVLGLVLGIILALNLVSLLPIFVIKILVQLKVYKHGSLGYEKYEHIDSEYKKSTRSRYYFRDENNKRETCTGKINVIMMGLCVVVFEVIAVGLYFLVR